MPEAIRLVIWDLDETFWRGTLSEGGITEYLQTHHDVVIELARRGIISSICSKNDFDAVKAILVEKDIWDYFVFPSIEWSAKGPRLARIIERFQLRPETVLFIDDNHGNREEARAMVPGLQIADETVAANLLTNSLCKGKNDLALSRLKQYKVLEEKSRQQEIFGSDNRAFLRASDIRVRIEVDIEAHLDRAIELINRTNQLNFTKRRLPDDPETARRELRNQLRSFDARAGLVYASDRYGDYGYVGFFLARGHWGENWLEHFAFSCRTLGMGVEQWVYAKLERPKIAIVGEVVASLDAETPDWINAEPLTAVAGDPGSADPAAVLPASVLLRGGCELEVAQHYFRMRSQEVSSEFLHLKGRQIIAKNHSSLLAQALRPLTPEIDAALRRLGWSPAEVETSVFRPSPVGRLVVFSPTGDQGSYQLRHKRLPICLPLLYSGYGIVQDSSEAETQAFFERSRLSETEIQEFTLLKQIVKQEYDLIVDGTVVHTVYAEIATHIPSTTFFVALKPNYERVDAGGQLVRSIDQIFLNENLDLAFGGRSNVALIDVRAHIPDLRLVVDNSFHHFDRSVYFALYQEISRRYAAWREVVSFPTSDTLSTRLRKLLPSIRGGSPQAFRRGDSLRS